MLLTAMLPLLVSMGIALWHSTNQTTKLTLETAQGRLDTAAQKLSRFFSERISEVATYSQTSEFKTMDFPLIRPFLMNELKRHGTIYEKFILGTPEGHFYNTSGGNPGANGLRTFNDSDPDAKPKHIRKRDYWQQTVGKNSVGKQTTYVSDPMISYTTGAKQIVVASTILSADGDVKGMIGGALPWTDIKNRIKQVNEEVVNLLGWDAKFFLVSHTGTYWYHWNPEKVVHLKLDEEGKPYVNNIGEKVVVKYNIKDEPISEFVKVGERMTKGDSGAASYIDPDSESMNYIVYSPIAATGYSIGLVVPKNLIMAPVKSLQSMFMYAFLFAAVFVVLVAIIVSRKFSAPIIDLNKIVKEISGGNWTKKLKPEGSDEIGELTRSFNAMAQSLERRENLLKESEEKLESTNQGLEQSIEERTSELQIANDLLNKQITDRVAAERALRRSEKLLKNTGHLAHVGGWKLVVKSGNLYWTDETFEIHGLLPEDNLSLDVVCSYFIPEHQSVFIGAINDAKKLGAAFDLELKIISKQRGPIWVRVICHAEKEDGIVTELTGAYQDITELKKVEQLKNEFISTVSHELRTPLTSICGALSLLNSGEITDVSSDGKQMLDIGERNANRLLVLINDLLDVEKIESGNMEFIFENCSISKLLQQSLVENESYARQLDVVYTLCANIHDVNINVDKLRFLQVMSNLLSNAAKFTKPETTIDISVLPIDDNVVRISVRDYGDGVPDNFKDKIFNKFSQADSSDTRKQGGTGLGLSISKLIVERMNGEIGYKDNDGEGATFYFDLPIAS